MTQFEKLLKTPLILSATLATLIIISVPSSVFGAGDEPGKYLDRKANMEIRVLNDKRQLIPVSACLDGQYGHSDVAIGVPAVIGKDGIHEIIELELDDAEKSVFDAGVTNVKNAIKSMDL